MIQSKTSRMLTALLATSFVAAAAAAEGPSGMKMPGMQMSGAPNTQEKLGHTTGKVVQIDAAHSKITIAHRPVAALGWPAMTMTFQSSPQQLKGIRAGDQVDFEFSVRGGTAVIERIHKTG